MKEQNTSCDFHFPAQISEVMGKYYRELNALKHSHNNKLDKVGGSKSEIPLNIRMDLNERMSCTAPFAALKPNWRINLRCSGQLRDVDEGTDGENRPDGSDADVCIASVQRRQSRQFPQEQNHTVTDLLYVSKYSYLAKNENPLKWLFHCTLRDMMYILFHPPIPSQKQLLFMRPHGVYGATASWANHSSRRRHFRRAFHRTGHCIEKKWDKAGWMTSLERKGSCWDWEWRRLSS